MLVNGCSVEYIVFEGRYYESHDSDTPRSYKDSYSLALRGGGAERRSNNQGYPPKANEEEGRFSFTSSPAVVRSKCRGSVKAIESKASVLV